MFVTGFDSLWMLTNQRLSYKLSATLSRTWIETSGCYWLVQALTKSLSNARRESNCLKSDVVMTQTRVVMCVLACMFAEVI